MKSIKCKAASVAAGLAAAVCFLLSAAVVHAAQPSAKAAPVAAQQPAIDTGPLIRPTDDPAKVAAARQFIMLYHPQIDPKNINKNLDPYIQRVIAEARKQNPKIDVKKLEQERRALFLNRGAASLNNQSHVVSRHFTLQELKDLGSFFSSPLGRKMAVEVPLITAEMRMAHRREFQAAMEKSAAKDNDDDDDEDDDDDGKASPSKPPAKPAAKPPVAQHK